MYIPPDITRAIEFFEEEQRDVEVLNERYFHMKVLLEWVEMLQNDNEELLDKLDRLEDWRGRWDED